MTSLMTLASKRERGRSLIALYVLHTLVKGEKSGYDILREIKSLTGGTWVPSKGTLYPLLRQLEEEGLIEPVGSENRPRSRNGFRITHSGIKTLERIRAHGQEHHKKMAQYRHLLVEILGNGKNEGMDTLMEIKMILEDLPKEQRAKAGLILRRCRDDLREVA